MRSLFSQFPFYTDTVNQDELEFFNEVAPDDEVKDDHQEYLDNANKLREKHREIKDSFDNLERKTSQGRNRREFVDPKVINLWNVALQNNFTASELAALKVFAYGVAAVVALLFIFCSFFFVREKNFTIRKFIVIFRRSYFILSQDC